MEGWIMKFEKAEVETEFEYEWQVEDKTDFEGFVEAIRCLKRESAGNHVGVKIEIIV